MQHKFVSVLDVAKLHNFLKTGKTQELLGHDYYILVSGPICMQKVTKIINTLM